MNLSIGRITALLLAGLASLTAGMARAAETASGAAAVPPLDVEPFAAVGVGKLLLGLIAVVALMVAMAWLMRRMGALSSAAAGSLRVLGGLSMGTRERIVLVQVGETQLLLGVAPGRVQTLHVLEQPIVIHESAKSGKGSFATTLGAALQRSEKS